MITKLTKENINEVKNSLLKKDATRYIEIYDTFLEDIKTAGIKIDNNNACIKRDEQLASLISKGATVENNNNSIYINGISPACIDCRKGLYSSTYILTLKCNRDCYFCTNKNQYNYNEAKNNINDIVADFKADFKRVKNISSVAITGGEPLLYPDKCYTFFTTVKNASAKINTRLYTNGDLATEDILKKLGSSGLDEIRFGIKINNDNSIDNEVYDKLKTATKYIKRVMVEMPFTLEQIELAKSLLLKLDEIGIFGINILEFLYPFQNSDDYAKNNYEVKNRPYDVLYDYSYAGGIPISKSDETCLELMQFAVDNNLKISVHYCNLENKLTSQVYQQNFRTKLSANEILSDKDFFIKSVRGYGLDDIIKIRERLENANVKHYIYNESDKFIEFSPMHIPLLVDLDIELGLSYLIVDYDEYERKIVREIGIDLIKPAKFELTDL